MKRLLVCVLGGFCASLVAENALGQQHRIFVQAAGQSPVGVPPEGVMVTIVPGQMITFDVYIEFTPWPPQRMIGAQVTLPCNLLGGTAGSINFVVPVFQDTERPDFCFAGPRYCDSGTNIGRVCANAAGCPGGDASPCPSAGSFPVTDDGVCPVPPPPAEGNPRAAIAAGIGTPAIVLDAGTGPCTFGSFTYQVSGDANGCFTLMVPNEPDSASRDQENLPIIFTTSGATLCTAMAPTGQCCMGLECLGDLTEADCLAAGGLWNDNASCLTTPCMCTMNSQCEDNNGCTNNVCQNGMCTFPSNVQPGMCCNPTNGMQTPINDNNECTTDACNTTTGMVTHTPVTNGTACADDGNPCTLNRCTDGVCTALDISMIPCTTDAECTAASGGASNSCGGVNPGFCDCVAAPPLTIQCDPSATPDMCEGGDNDGMECMSGADCPGGVCVEQTPSDPECFGVDEKVNLRVVLGGGTVAIVGGQFLLRYDPTCLDFRTIAPGAMCDDASPFELELFSNINESTGEIFYAVGVTLAQGGGTNTGGVLACINFAKIGECADCEVCFADENPQNTYLSGRLGELIEPELPDGGCGCHIRTKGETTLTVPEGGTFNADCDAPTATVNWMTAATATNTCDGPLDVVCTCMHTDPLVTPAECSALIANGGEFPQGTATFCCSATDSCGERAEGCWEVTVTDQTTMDLELQLSPTMTTNRLTRCIEFGFFSNCVEDVEIFREDIVFGPPFDFPGHATYQIKVPKGQFACLTARDPLHTLRATADLECTDGILVASFKGDPFFGGSWLTGGNLNGDHVIDILDFGVVIGQYLNAIEPNTECSEIIPNFLHADINGDGTVDSLDFIFVQSNFLLEDKDSCCPDDEGGAGLPPGRTSITVRELRLMGMGYLAASDVNGDGVLDIHDMEAVLTGQVQPPVRTLIAQPAGPVKRIGTR